MNIVSVKFKNNECFIPEVLVSAKAMNQGLERLKPQLAAAKVEPRGKVVIGSIQGDLHDIGKNIVGMLLQGAGYEIIDLGADVPVQKFVDAAKERQADVVGMSSLLTTTMVNMHSVVSGLEGAGIRPDVKVIIGGAPVTPAFAEQIGADGYAPDAASAIDLVDGLLGKQPRERNSEVKEKKGRDIMNLAKRAPILGILAGIALIIVGFINKNNALLIVGAVLIAFGIFRQFQK
jgi:5-methyltetrahydrofolate--homocysteine methyltransferase